MNEDNINAKIDLNSSKSMSKKSDSLNSSIIIKKKSKKRKTRDIVEENNSDAVRREKNEYLFKLKKLNGADMNYSSVVFTMDSSLEDLRNEYERIHKEIQVSTSVKFYKTVLVMGTRGIEMLNAQYDPLGIDLDGFADSMTYSVDTPSYDEVLTELAEKYKSMGNVSPELKLVGLLAMSGFGYVASKKMTKSMEENRRYENNKRQQQQQQQQVIYETDSDSDDSSAKMPRPDTTFNSKTVINDEPDDIEIKDSDMESVLNKMHQNAETNRVEQEKIIEIAPKKRGRPVKKA